MSPLYQVLEEDPNCLPQMKGNWLGSSGPTQEPARLKTTMKWKVPAWLWSKVYMDWQGVLSCNICCLSHISVWLRTTVKLTQTSIVTIDCLIKLKVKFSIFTVFYMERIRNSKSNMSLLADVNPNFSDNLDKKSVEALGKTEILCFRANWVTFWYVVWLKDNFLSVS